MKKIIALLSVSLLIIGLQDTYGQGQADIKFDNTNHQFGKIKEDGGLAVHNFNFANTGNVPLIISAVNASCGCTTPEWSKEPVLPGKTGFVN